MNKEELIKIKKRLLALGLAGVIFGTTGCTSNIDENGVPKRQPITFSYSKVNNYYKYAVKDGEAAKVYKAENVFLLYDKANYDVSEYLYNTTWLGGGELYDLKTEEMLVYGDGLGLIINEDFYNYIRKNNYQVCLAEVSDYVEGITPSSYYSLAEIKELEPLILEGLKIINSDKVKSK